MCRSGAAAAADEVDQAALGKVAENGGHVLRGFVVTAELVGEPCIGVGAHKSRRHPGKLLDILPQSLSAESAVKTYAQPAGAGPRSPCARGPQLSPAVSGRAWATEFQNASVTWPESVRPLASVMVPEIITGT